MTSTLRVSAVLLAFVAGPAFVWAEERVQAQASARASDRASTGSPVLAEVDGEPIAEQEVAEAAGAAYARLQEQLYGLKRQRLQELIDARLLESEAGRRGMDVPALLAFEVAAKAPVGDEEVKAYVEAHADEFRPQEPPEKRAERARARLSRERQRARRVAFLAELRSRARIVEHLAPPLPYRAPVSTDGAPARGPAGAPVTIVQFSDFHCPACRGVQGSLEQVRARYGDKVRLVYRDFPLDRPHPQARRAAEAARCAGEQGRFWPFHDVLYRSDADASDAALKRFATETSLDLSAFESCVASGRYAAAVRADEEAGRALGVNSTPSFFVNGRAFNGAQPFDSFAKIIDQELGRAGR